MNEWEKLEQDARRQMATPSEQQNLSTIAADLRRRAIALGSANALLWGILRIRVEHDAGCWRLALALPTPTIGEPMSWPNEIYLPIITR